MDIIGKISKYEEFFSENNFDGAGKTAFTIEKGKIPVIISAPHSVNQYREGNLKYSDMYTGAMAKYFNEIMGCHIIYLSKNTKIDPNYDDKKVCKYKNTLSDYIEKNDIKFLIDLHASRSEHDYLTELGTIDKNNSSLVGKNYLLPIITNAMENSLKNAIKETGKGITVNTVFPAANPNTVTNFISSKNKIPCIQFEINRLCRNPNKPEYFKQMINGLETIIQEVENIL